MSVYIPGIEMPTNCLDCPVYWDKCPNWDAEGNEYSERIHPDCPLVPVPEHGDLIDREALEKDIDKYIGGEESRSRFHHWVQVQSVVIPGDKGEET